jgi:hypothetical protein
MLNLKYNDITGDIVKYDPKVGLTPEDEVVTQEELLQWMGENPGSKDEQAERVEDIESLTVKETPDSTEIEEGVETITERG